MDSVSQRGRFGNQSRLKLSCLTCARCHIFNNTIPPLLIHNLPLMGPSIAMKRYEKQPNFDAAPLHKYPQSGKLVVNNAGVSHDWKTATD